MKPPLLLSPHRLSRVLLALSLAWAFHGSGRAADPAVAPSGPVSQQLDVFFGETKILPIDGVIDDYAVVPENIVRVEKTSLAPNQLTIVGLAGGSATLTIKSTGRTFLYDIAVTRAPVRLYINLNESKRVTFPAAIDDTQLSDAGVITATQPDNNDKVLLLQAQTAGKTTLTVFVKNDIYRYFISTFDNRGADVLEIQNAFSAKGYRNLAIAFDKDQAIISGSVPTQEELDDAVKIVKQFTQYVIVKAQLGLVSERSEYTEQEAIVINNIQRIANVKGLTVRVKFPAPTVTTTTTQTRETGDYIQPTVVTTPQGGTVKGSGFQPPTSNPQDPTANLSPIKPRTNTTETSTTTENTTIPEKIFLYGNLEDDLAEARVLRVARTFCPFVVNFITVRDPIQLRVKLRFMQVNKSDAKAAGVSYINGSGTPGLGATLGFFGGPGFNYLVNNDVQNLVQTITNNYFYGLNGQVGGQATLQLLQTLNLLKLVRTADLVLTNGQPGWYSEGEVQYYLSASVTTATGAAGIPLTTVTASPIFIGLNMDIAPLNVQKAGTQEPSGQRVLGLPSSVSDNGSTFTVETNNFPTAEKVGTVSTIQRSGGAPVIDSTVKYVDENGLIGLDISTQLTVPRSAPTRVTLANGNFIDLPDVFIRSTRTRVNLRDGQTVAINGLIDKQSSRTITKIPFLSDIPILGDLFKNYNDSKQNNEVLVLVTPQIVRSRDSDSARFPKPVYREMQDVAAENNEVPIIKPVRYEGPMAIRPEDKDMKDSKNSEAPALAPTTTPVIPSAAEMLQPHASGGLQTLQPPPEPMKPAQPVDNPPANSDTHAPSDATPRAAPPTTMP